MNKKAVALGGSIAVVLAAALVVSKKAAVYSGPDFYVSPTATSSGDGSIGNPWQLQTALNGPSVVQPGNTIYLRGGTYAGQFISAINGTLAAPINFKVYPASATPGDARTEHVVFDGGTDPSVAAILKIKSNSLRFWDIDITSSSTVPRVSTEACNPNCSWPSGAALPISYGVDCWQAANYCNDVKLINVRSHDTRINGGSVKLARDMEIYGGTFYYEGWQGPDRLHGHDLYLQHFAADANAMKLIDSLLFDASEWTLHSYGSSDANLDNFWMEGNALVRGGGGVSLVGGTFVLKNLTKKDNVYYGGPVNDGYQGCCGGGFNGANISGEYIFGALQMQPPFTGVSMTGGQYWLEYLHDPNISTLFPNNGWHVATWPNPAPRPTSNFIVVRPNIYSPGRERVWAFNWLKLATLQASVAGVLNAGDHYEVRSAFDFWAGPLPGYSNLTYSGGTITLPGGALTMPTAYGKATPPSTGQDFLAFDIVRVSTGGAPSPPPTPAQSPSAIATQPPNPTSTVTSISTPSTTPSSISSPTRTPTPGPSGQSVYLEAESGNRLAPMVAMANDPLASGGVYLTSPTRDAGSVSFSINALAPGAVHYVWHRTICLNDSGNTDSFFVSLDGEADAAHIDDMCATAPRGTAWLWTKATDRALGEGTRWARPLAAGPHSLTFRARETNTKLDRIAVTTDPNWIPSDIQPQPTATLTPTTSPTSAPPTSSATQTPTRTWTPAPPTSTPTVTPSNPPPIITICIQVTALPTVTP